MDYSALVVAVIAAVAALASAAYARRAQFEAAERKAKLDKAAVGRSAGPRRSRSSIATGAR